MKFLNNYDSASWIAFGVLASVVVILVMS